MTDAGDFLAAIIDRPDDDLPRLVYADFLDERGDPERAEFIRVQCELARLPAADPDRGPLRVREAELRKAHVEQWKIPELRGHQAFRRGFVEVVETAAAWLLAAKGVFEQTPVRNLRIGNVDPHIDELIRLPGLARVEALNLQANHLAGGDRLRRLFTEGRFERLRWLSLQNNRLWPENFESFTRTPVAARLTSLHVSGNPLSDAGAEILAQAPAFANLTELVFRNDEQQYENSLHANGAGELARSTTLTGLRELNLSGHYIGDAGLIELVTSRNAAGLVALDVSYNDIGALGESSVDALVGSRHLGSLRRLSLAGNELNRLAVRALLEWPRLRDGVQIDLTDVHIGAAEREAIIRSGFAGQIEVSPWGE